MKNRSMMNAPLLTKLSTFRSTPKWTLSSGQDHDTLFTSSADALGPAAYNTSSCIDSISKFQRISTACSFGTSKRFNLHDSKVSLEHAPPGPGQYSPPPDYSRSPYRSSSSATFGSGGRLFPKRLHGSCPTGPGPNEYDIRGKHRFGGLSFDTKGAHLNDRHGWFYDNEVKARRNNPSPGAYDPKYPRDSTNVLYSFGSAPRLPREGAQQAPPPGTYDIKTSLGGRSYSFRHSVAKPTADEHTMGPLYNQPTQFG